MEPSLFAVPGSSPGVVAPGKSGKTLAVHPSAFHHVRIIGGR
jgi:hypothetical protein